VAARVFDEALLAVLRCPQTQQTLTVAPPVMIVGRADADGRPLQAALLRADGVVLYPIRDGIPVLLSEAAVSVEVAGAIDGA
jgi:uncharacterized protein YbaR (Trm112 family)